MTGKHYVDVLEKRQSRINQPGSHSCLLKAIGTIWNDGYRNTLSLVHLIPVPINHYKWWQESHWYNVHPGSKTLICAHTHSCPSSLEKEGERRPWLGCHIEHHQTDISRHTTVWCSRMLVAPKKDGSPKRTVDLQKLNAAVMRETQYTLCSHLTKYPLYSPKPKSCPVGWGCRIHQLHLYWGVRPPQQVSWIWH